MASMKPLYQNLCVTSAVIVDKCLWFCSAWFNFLFKCNLQNNEIEEAIALPIGYAGIPTLIINMFFKDQSIFLVANNSNNNLLKYNIMSGTMEKIPVAFDENAFGNFSDEDEEYIFLPVVEKKQIISLRKDDFKIEKHWIDCKGDGIQLIKKIDKGFIIIETRVGDVVVTDDEYNILNRISEKPDGFEMAYDRYYPGVGIAYLGDEIIVFPRYANMVYSVCLSEQKVRQIGEKFSNFINFRYGPRFSCVKKMKECLWVFSSEEDVWILFDDNLNEINRIHMKFSLEVENKLSNINIIECNAENVQIINENHLINTLENFINSLLM